MTRPASDVLADLAALASRQAALTAELAEALRSPVVAAPVRPANDTPEYLTTAEAAALLGVSAGHLKALRAAGAGPRHLRVGRSVRYARADLAASDTVRAPSVAADSAPSAVRRLLRFR